ncbi:hypothetical protein ACA910_010545 [Epithemia clementina (nom. ined.)]
MNNDNTKAFQNTWIWLATVAVTATVAVYQHAKKKNTAEKKKKRRGVPRNPEGILATLGLLDGPEGHKFLLEQSEKMGELVYRIVVPRFPDYNVYIVGHPKLVREILTDPLTDKAEILYQQVNYVTCGIPNMFSSPNNQHWKLVRKGTAPAFSTSEVSRMRQVCDSQLDRWIEHVLEPTVKAGGKLDPYKEMVNLAFRTICEAAFEYPHVTDEDITCFTENLDLAMVEFDRKQTAFPFRQYLTPFLKERQRAFEGCRKIQELGQRILDHYRDLDDSKKSPNNTVIRLLVQNEHLVTDRMIVAEMLVFVIGGHDTTGFTLGASLYHFAKYPKVHERLIQSLKDSQDAKSSSSSYNASNDDNYFQWFVRETFRVLPVAAFGAARTTGREFVVPPPPLPRAKKESTVSSKSPTSPTTSDGEESDIITVIPKGAMLLAPQYVANCSSLVFERPLEFDPLRWQDASAEMVQAVMPFSIGNRNCIAQALAQTELNTILTAPKFLEKYSWEIAEEGRAEFAFTLRLVGMRLKPILRQRPGTATK